MGWRLSTCCGWRGVSKALTGGAGARTFVLTAVGGEGEASRLVAPLETQLSQLGLAVSTVTAGELMSQSAVPATISYEDNRREGLVAMHLDRLNRLSDLTLITVPALLMSAESEYLVRCADATILVVESGVTKRGQVLQAALLLERLQVRGVGAVLDGLQLQYADAGFRYAVAELERRGRQASGANPFPSKQEKIEDTVSETVFETARNEPGQKESLASQVVPLGSEQSTVADEVLEVSASLGTEWSEKPAMTLSREMESVTPSEVKQEIKWFSESTDEPYLAAVPGTELSNHGQEVSPTASVMVVPAEHFVAQHVRTLDRLPRPDETSGMSLAPEKEGEDVSLPEQAVVTQPPVEVDALRQQDLAKPEQTFEKQALMEVQNFGSAGLHAAGTEIPVLEPAGVGKRGQAQEASATQVEVVEQPLPETPSGLEESIVAEPVGDLALGVESPVSVPDTQAEVSERTTVVPASETKRDAQLVPAEVQAVSPTDHVWSPAALNEWPGSQSSESVRTGPAKVLAEPLGEPQRIREPLRVARWEPVDSPSRAEVTPWRDRRVSGPSGSYRAAERRYNWSAGAASREASEGASPAPAKVASEWRGPAPRLVPSDGKATSSGKLTRSWGLLSKFGLPSETESGQDAGGDSGTWNSQNRRRG